MQPWQNCVVEFVVGINILTTQTLTELMSLSVSMELLIRNRMPFTTSSLDKRKIDQFRITHRERERDSSLYPNIFVPMAEAKASPAKIRKATKIAG